jgi:hypothetical protein
VTAVVLVVPPGVLAFLLLRPEHDHTVETLGVCWLVFAAVSLRAPDLIMESVERLGARGLHSATSGETPIMALAALGMFSAAAWRFFAEYRVSALPARATLAAGMVFLGEAQLAM